MFLLKIPLTFLFLSVHFSVTPPLLLLLYVLYAHTCMSTCRYIHSFMHTWCWMSSSITFCFISSRQVLLFWIHSLPYWLYWLVIELQLSLLWPATLGFQAIFKWILLIWTQRLMFLQQVFYQLTHLPAQEPGLSASVPIVAPPLIKLSRSHLHRVYFACPNYFCFGCCYIWLLFLF